MEEQDQHDNDSHEGSLNSSDSLGEETTPSSDDSTQKSEQVSTFELGEFEVKSVHPDGENFPEIRLSHEGSQSTIILRQPIKGLKSGDIVSLIATRK